MVSWRCSVKICPGLQISPALMKMTIETIELLTLLLMVSVQGVGQLFEIEYRVTSKLPTAPYPNDCRPESKHK